MFNKQRVALVGVVLLLVVLTAACGGSSGLSGPEYFGKLQALDDASEQSQEQLQSTYTEALAAIPEDAVGQERLTAEMVFYEGLVQIGKDYVNEVDDLAPPGEVKEEHDEYVTAYDEVLIQLNKVVDELPGVTSLGGINELLSNGGLTTSYDRANRACAELQASAPRVDAQVDLRCQK